MIMIHVYSEDTGMVASKVFTTDVHQPRMLRSLMVLQEKLLESAKDARISVFDDDRNLLLESFLNQGASRLGVSWMSADISLERTASDLWSAL